MAAPSQTSPHHASETSVPETPKPTESTSPSVIDETMPESPMATPTPPPTSNPPRPPHVLTYEGTESSDAFLLAKNLLNNGDFDDAMETIGAAMGTIVSQLPEDEAAIHESLAPLYYLYGTTLLYSIEESTSSDALQTQPSSTTTTIAPSQAGGEDEETQDDADDSQIAWENLETARLIVTKMLDNTKKNDNTNDTEPNNNNHHYNKLVLDLAQIHLRLGDLQRANGRYHDSVADYTKCLELRQPILGTWDRKVADTHYNLGLVYMMMTSEGDKQQQPQPQQQQEEDKQEPILSPQRYEEYRRKALSHYLAGGKAFCGQIAFLCGVDPEQMTADIQAAELEQQQLQAATTTTTTTTAQGKTSGMEESELQTHAVSATLKVMRARVAPLQPTPTTGGGDDSVTAVVYELKEILDEIQETIDEAESAKRAIGEVSELKARAQAAAEGEGGEVINMDGSTTTIGFGSTAAVAAASSSTMLATAPPLQQQHQQQPMMVVRKKKKMEQGESQKMPADDTKRAKLK